MASKGEQLVERFYPEQKVGGFTRASVSVQFLVRVAALLAPEQRVLDYGAGRGGYIDNDKNAFGRWLKTLKGRVAFVEGCDVDPAVLDNPYLDHAEVINPDKPLPYAEGSFDVILSTWVFEHVDKPEIVAPELLRVLKPGGYICAITPNKNGYISLAARLASNKNHIRFLRKIQPARLDFDVFPTRYRLNTAAALRKWFKGCEVTVLTSSSEPSYHFNSSLLFRAFKLLHAVTPAKFHTTLMIFVRKPA